MRYALALALIALSPLVARADEPAPKPAKLAPDELTTADWISVAKQFTEHGDAPRAALAWCRVLAADADHAVARAELRFTRAKDGRWTPSAAASLPKQQPATLALLRKAYDAAQTLAGRRAVLARFAECRTAKAGVALAYAATHDKDALLRAAALVTLRAHGTDEAAYALHTQLRAKSPRARIRAATAMGDLQGSRLAPRLLAANWVGTLGRGPRVNITIGVIKAYIADFEVEVASFAAIGDPHVAVVREGIKLDHQVLGGSTLVTSQVARASRRALAKLAGRDLGNDPRRWVAYLNAEPKPAPKDTEASNGAK